MKGQPQQIVLEYNFDLHQKIHLSFYAAFCLLLILELRDVPINFASVLFFIFFLLIFLFFTALIFLKKGFLIRNNRLYTASFIRGIPLHKRVVDLKNKPVISVLKFKKRQKFAFFSAAKPDLAHQFNAFDLYLLNERHTQKLRLFSFKQEGVAKDALKFLLSHTSLKNEVYSPRYSGIYF